MAINTNIKYVHGTDAGEPLYGGDGQDRIYGYGGDDELFGLGSNDVLVGGAGADDLWGGDGIDTADYSQSSRGVIVNLATGQGRGGDAEGDFLWGIENLKGSGQSDILTGDRRDNKLEGGGGDDTLNGASGDDELIGGAGNDALNGGLHNDMLRGGAGADELNGGDGIDTADYYSLGSLTPTAGIAVYLNLGVAYGGEAQGDTFSGIENVIGSGDSDFIQGNSVDNVLSGNNGQDSLFGREGNDTLDGGGGADYLKGGTDIDTLRGGLGDDRLEGGAGGDILDGGADFTYNGAVIRSNDTAEYTESNAGVTIDLRDGIATGGHAAGDTLISIENLVGSNFRDTLRGDNRVNHLFGGGDVDTLIGRGGDDVLTGGDGGDTLEGGDNNDTLDGGRGNDTMRGGAHNDTFTGFLSGTDIVTGGTGDDSFEFTVTDDDFDLTVTDWNPMLFPDGNDPTEAAVIASTTTEHFLLTFMPESGVVDEDGDGILSAEELAPFATFSVVGSDVVLAITTPTGLDGRIVFQGVADLFGPVNDTATVLTHYAEWNLN
jgi:Ca2+-binding RTX toxin-like protein